jgi:hypothetical protein
MGRERERERRKKGLKHEEFLSCDVDEFQIIVYAVKQLSFSFAFPSHFGSMSRLL